LYDTKYPLIVNLKHQAHAWE